MTVATGDPPGTAAVNSAKEVVLDSMRANASYVEILASNSLENILSSGFQAASTNHAQYPLDQPVILDLSNLAPTQLLLRLTPIMTAKSYRCRRAWTLEKHGRRRASIRRPAGLCWGILCPAAP